MKLLCSELKEGLEVIVVINRKRIFFVRTIKETTDSFNSTRDAIQGNFIKMVIFTNEESVYYKQCDFYANSKKTRTLMLLEQMMEVKNWW